MASRMNVDRKTLISLITALPMRSKAATGVSAQACDGFICACASFFGRTSQIATPMTMITNTASPAQAGCR